MVMGKVRNHFPALFGHPATDPSTHKFSYPPMEDENESVCPSLKNHSAAKSVDGTTLGHKSLQHYPSFARYFKERFKRLQHDPIFPNCFPKCFRSLVAQQLPPITSHLLVTLHLATAVHLARPVAHPQRRPKKTF